MANDKVPAYTVNVELLKNSVICTWVIVVVLLDVTCASRNWRRWTGRWKWLSWLDDEANTSRYSLTHYFWSHQTQFPHRWSCISRPPSFSGRGSSLLRGWLHSGQWRQRTRLADEAEREAVAAGKNVWHFLPSGTCVGNHGLSERWEETRNHKSWDRGEGLEAQAGEMRFDLLTGALMVAIICENRCPQLKTSLIIEVFQRTDHRKIDSDYSHLPDYLGFEISRLRKMIIGTTVLGAGGGRYGMRLIDHGKRFSVP